MGGEQDDTKDDQGAQDSQEGQGAPEGDQAGKQAEPAGSGQTLTGDDYRAQLEAKDAQIAELQGKVAEAAKSQEATEALGKEIAELKQQLADERTDFALKAAGARSVKAARALLGDHGGDVDKLREAEPWLFSPTGQQTSGGTTGLEPAGASGGSDEGYVRRWEKIAGLDDKGKE